MAQFLVSTTGLASEVVVEDLGARLFIHPTVDKDLMQEYTRTELVESSDLQAAITNGYLTAKDGSGNPITDLENWFQSIGGGGSSGGVPYACIHLFDDEGGSDYTSNTYWQRIGFGLLNMDVLKNTVMIFFLRAYRYGRCGPVYGRIRDITNNVTLAEVTFESGEAQWHSMQLSNLPSSGYIDIELQVKVSSRYDKIYYYWAFIEVRGT